MPHWSSFPFCFGGGFPCFFCLSRNSLLFWVFFTSFPGNLGLRKRWKILAFLSVFHFFSRDFRASEEVDILALFWAFSRKNKVRKIKAFPAEMHFPEGQCGFRGAHCKKAQEIAGEFPEGPKDWKNSRSASKKGPSFHGSQSYRETETCSMHAFQWVVVKLQGDLVAPLLGCPLTGV